MGKFEDLVGEQQKIPKIDKATLGGWPTLAQAYRELDPGVSYQAFRYRVLQGKSVIEAGTMPRSKAGRPIVYKGEGRE